MLLQDKAAFFGIVSTIALSVVAAGSGIAAENFDERGAQPDCAIESSDFGTVVEVIDGDTLKLAGGRIIRLAGIEAPKAYLARPGAEISAVEEAARRGLERLVAGKNITIRHSRPESDRHGRILAQVWLEDGTWLQEALVSEGLARVRPFADETSCLALLRASERDARESDRGLWQETEFSVISAYDPSLIERMGLYVIVEGRVLSVGHGDRVDFLNFGNVWRRDFTVLVAGPTAEILAEAGRSTDAMVGERVRVRGILEESGGPAIRLRNPDEIEILGDG